MYLVKGIKLEHYNSIFKASIGDAYINVRKIETVSKSCHHIKWIRGHFYSVRKIGNNIRYKTQCMVPLTLIETLRDTLVEKDGKFMFSCNGIQPDGTRIHIAYPDYDNPHFECYASIKKDRVLQIYQQFSDIPVRNWKMKKRIKRVMFEYKPSGRRRCHVTQMLIINAHVMRRMIDLLVGDGENGYYFDYDKVEKEEGMI